MPSDDILGLRGCLIDTPAPGQLHDPIGDLVALQKQEHEQQRHDAAESARLLERADV